MVATQLFDTETKNFLILDTIFIQNTEYIHRKFRMHFKRTKQFKNINLI